MKSRQTKSRRKTAKTHKKTRTKTHPSEIFKNVSPTLATNDTVEAGKLAVLNRNLKSIGLAVKKHLLSKGAVSGATVVYALHHVKGPKDHPAAAVIASQHVDKPEELAPEQKQAATEILNKVGKIVDNRVVLKRQIEKKVNDLKDELKRLKSARDERKKEKKPTLILEEQMETTKFEIAELEQKIKNLNLK